MEVLGGESARIELPFLYFVLAVGVFLFGLRIYLAAQHTGPERLVYFRRFTVVLAPYYLFLLFWGLWPFSMVFFLFEGASWLGVYGYASLYRKLFASPREVGEVAWKLVPFFSGSPEKHVLLEEAPLGPLSLSLSTSVLSWHQGRLRVWVFPHQGVFKESGGKWWVPALPKGVNLFLREKGREGDVLYFPFAFFAGGEVSYTGKYHVLVGPLGEGELEGHLAMIGRVRAHLQGLKDRKRLLVEELLRELPGWRAWHDLPFEDKGSLDVLLRSPGGELYGLFLVSSGKDEEKARALAKWLPFPTLLLPAGRRVGEREEGAPLRLSSPEEVVRFLREREGEEGGFRGA